LGRKKGGVKEKGKKVGKRKGEGRRRDRKENKKSIRLRRHVLDTQDIIYFSSQLSSPLKAILKTNDHLTADQTTRGSMYVLFFKDARTMCPQTKVPGQ
jgi:hypothetical protein